MTKKKPAQKKPAKKKSAPKRDVSHIPAAIVRRPSRSPPVERTPGEIDVIEVLDRVLNKGIIFEDISKGIDFMGIEVVRVDIRVRVVYLGQLPPR